MKLNIIIYTYIIILNQLNNNVQFVLEHIFVRVVLKLKNKKNQL